MIMKIIIILFLIPFNTFYQSTIEYTNEYDVDFKIYSKVKNKLYRTGKNVFITGTLED